MLQVAMQMARRRLSALVAVALAVLGGAACLTVAGVLAETGMRSHPPVGRLAGADVVVSADQTIRAPGDITIGLPERRTVPAALVGRLAQVPGVTAAVGDLSFPAAVVDARGAAVPGPDPAVAGHGWQSTQLLEQARVEGRAPAGSDEVALASATAAAAGVRRGGRVTVVAAGRSAEYRITAVVRGAPAGIYMADAVAARIAGRIQGPRAGTVDLVGLRVAAGEAGAVSAAVREAVKGDGLSVSTGSARGDATDAGAAAARSNLLAIAGSLAGTVLLLVAFVVTGASSLLVEAQRRDLALLRAVGATPRQIRRLAAAQTSLMTAVALLPGVLLGYVLSSVFKQLLTDAGLVPDDLPLAASPLPALVAAVVVVLVVQLSTRGAARKTSRMPATEAVRESQVEPRQPSRIRTVAGLLLIVGAMTLSIVPLWLRTVEGAAATAIAGILAAIGLGLCGPALIRIASKALAVRLPGSVSAPAWLAVANTRGYSRRAAAITTALAMVVVFTLTYFLSLTTVTGASSRDVRAATLAQQTIDAPALGGVPEDTLARVEATPGVRAAAPVSTTTVLWPYEELGEPTIEAAPATILTAAAPGVLDLDVRAGRMTDLVGSTIAVGSDVARRRDAGLNSRVRLILGDGSRVTARVVAVYRRDLGFGPVVLSRDLATGHTTAGLDQSVLVRTDGSAAAERGLASIVASSPGVVLSEANGDAGRGSPPEAAVNFAVVGVLLGYLLLGVTNRLVATMRGRQGEIAALRLLGATPRQIRRMLRLEAGLVCAAALTCGLLLAAVPLAFLGIGFLDRPLPSGPLWLLPFTVLVVAAVTFITTEHATRWMLRRSPLRALAQAAN